MTEYLYDPETTTRELLSETPVDHCVIPQLWSIGQVFVEATHIFFLLRNWVILEVP